MEDRKDPEFFFLVYLAPLKLNYRNDISLVWFIDPILINFISTEQIFVA